MLTDIKYEVIDSDFEIIYIKDGKKEHQDASKPYIWGAEYVLKRNLSSYYYFEVNRMNSSKKTVPGDAYVNGVKAETVGERGKYIIDRELVQEPLIIQIESINGYLVRFPSLSFCDYVALEGDKVDIQIFDYKIHDYYHKNFKAGYTFYKAGTKEVVTLEEYEETNNGSTPVIKFIMPPFDMDVEIAKVEDNNKITITIDESSIEDIEANTVLFSHDGIVTEAFYSDDYDFGVRDHYFCERKISFKKGTKVRIIVYLLEKKRLVCLYNDKEYTSYPLTKEVGERELYTYEFKPLILSKDGVISFRVSEYD